MITRASATYTEAYFVRSDFRGLRYSIAVSDVSRLVDFPRNLSTCVRTHPATGNAASRAHAGILIHAGHAGSISTDPCSDNGEHPRRSTPRKRTEAHHQLLAFRLCPELAASRASRASRETPAHVARSIFFISLRRSLIVDVLVLGIACPADSVAVC